jgi:hypothetical protein
MTSGQYVRNDVAYEWSDRETYTVTFDITVDTDYGYQDRVDVYFVDTYNFNLYYNSQNLNFIWRVLGLGEGSWSYDLTGFEPDPALDYWLVIDDTSTFATAAVPDVSGSFEVTWVRTSPNLYTVDGWVRDAGDQTDVADAYVSIDRGKYTAYTDSTGFFSIESVPAGTYHVDVTATNYVSYETDYLTVSGDTTRVFELEPVERVGTSGLVLGIIGGIIAVAVVLVIVILTVKKRKTKATASDAAPSGSWPPDRPATIPEPIASQEQAAPAPMSSATEAPAQIRMSPEPEQTPQQAPPPHAGLFCTNCGAPLPAERKFCRQCGFPVDGYWSTDPEYDPDKYDLFS